MRSHFLDTKYPPFYFQICFDAQHFVPSLLHSTWTPAASRRECAPAIMTASACGLLRQPVQGEIAALAPCILWPGCWGGLCWRSLCGFSGLSTVASPSGVWWGNFSWGDIPGGKKLVCKVGIIINNYCAYMI